MVSGASAGRLVRQEPDPATIRLDKDASLNDGFFLVVKKNVLYFHLFNVVFENHVPNDLLLGLALLLVFLSFFTQDLLLLKPSPAARLPFLLQASRIDKYAVHNVERVPEPVIG